MDEFEGMNYAPLSLHKYMFANASPINNYDPSGLVSIAGVASFGASLNIRAILLTTTIATLSTMEYLKHKYDTLIELYHYTTENSLFKIELFDTLMTGISGKIFFTDYGGYISGVEALNKLALVGMANRGDAPDVIIKLSLFVVRDGVIGPLRVLPQRTKTGLILHGGGTEYYVTKPINYRSRVKGIKKIPKYSM